MLDYYYSTAALSNLHVSFSNFSFGACNRYLLVRDSRVIPFTTTTVTPTRTQERLSWLLDQYVESARKHPSGSHTQPSNDVPSKNLSERVFELLSKRNLLDGPLSKAATPVRILYPEMPRDVLTAWWEERDLAPLSGPSTTSPTPVEKENIPPTTSPAHISITTPSATAAPPSTRPLMEPPVPCPPEAAIQAVSRPTIDESANDDPTSSQRISSHEQSAQVITPPAKETPKPSRPALSSISNVLPNATRPGAPTTVASTSPAASSALKRPLEPSTAPIALLLQSNKRQKQSYVADPDDSNPTTEIVTGAATKEPLRSDELQNDALQDKLAHTILAEASHDQQSVPMLKDIGDPVAAKRRFLYERMNIFDITSEWEPTPPQARRLEREEGEGGIEYLVRRSLL
ncbi:hypothetical protein BDZ89DRAFT_1078559 [Hymenopellis radicata]|nr:hypothetical protein BDZ89DRAFT_1078559 [Hymenopellis radicata]